jgi:hypothetical protein
MSSSNLVRTGGGLASATAGTLLLVGHLLNLGGDLEYGTVLGESLVLAAHLLLVFGLVALYAAQAEESGSLGCSGDGGERARHDARLRGHYRRDRGRLRS